MPTYATSTRAARAPDAREGTPPRTRLRSGNRCRVLVLGALIGSVLSACLIAAVPASAVNFTAGQNAARQVGSPDWTGTTIGSATLMGYGLYEPNGVAVDSSGSVYVADTRNNRLLRWGTTPATDGAAFSTVLMKANASKASFVRTCLGGSRKPEQVSVVSDGPTQKLAVADRDNHRIVLSTSESTVDGTTGTVFLGQGGPNTCGSNRGLPAAAADSLNSPSGVWTNGSKVAVADTANNRVLLWDNWPTTGQPADRVLGQADFTQRLANRGLLTAAADTMNAPHGVYFDGTYLYVADSTNNRVLVWNGWPGVNGTSATWVIGQPDMATTTSACLATKLDYPQGIATTGTGAAHRIAITDDSNDRVVVLNGFPTAPASGPTFSSQVGQASLTTCSPNRSGSTSAALNSLRAPTGLNFDSSGNLWVADVGNHRVLRYATLANPSSDRVLGHAGVTSGTASIPLDAGGGELAMVADVGMTSARSDGARVAVTPSGTLFVADQTADALMQWNGGPALDDDPFTYRWGEPTTWDSGDGGPGGGTSAILSRNPTDVWTDGTRLLVSEEGGDRVLVWTTLPASNNDPADFVLGQTTMSGSTSSAGQAGLHDPGGVTSNGTDIAVSDRTNNRIMIWKNFFGAPSNGKNADIVLGQPDFTSLTGGSTQSKILTPDEIDLDQDVLALADYGNNRVLVWRGFSTLATNAPADAVVGQANFTASGSGTITENATGVAVAGDSVLWTSDCDAHVLDPVPSSGATTAAPIIGTGCSISTTGQARYEAPTGIDAANGKVWLANTGHGRVMRWDDTTAPAAIAAPTAAVRCDGTVTLTWTTSESTTSDVYYDTVTRSAVYTSYASSALDPLYSGLTHTKDLSFASPGTKFAMVRGVDWAGLATVSPEVSFTIPATCPSPTTMLADDANAQSGFGRANPSTTNAPPIRVPTWHTSWLNVAGVTMDSRESQEWTTPPEHAGALWHLDGSTAADANAAHTGAVTWTGAPPYTTGRFGQAISLDGSSQYGTVANDPALNRTSNFSIDTWVRSTDLTGGTYRSVVMKSVGGGCGPTGTCSFALEYDVGSDRMCAVIMRNDDVEFNACGSNAATLADGQWHHLAMTFDAAFSLRLYVDGVLMGSPIAVGGPMQLNTQPMRIGSAGNGGSLLWRGDIDEVHVTPLAYDAGAILGYYRTSRPHAQQLHASGITPLGTNCVTATRCVDATYAGAASVLRDGARFYTRTRLNTLNNDYWTTWANDWVEVEQLTTLTVTTGPAIDFGSVLPGANAFGTTTAQVTTNSAAGYQLTAHDESDTWGLQRIAATESVADRQDGAVAPATWPAAASGFYGVTVRDAPGGRLAKWGPGTATAESDVTSNLYTGLEATSEVVLHSRSTYSTAPEDVLITWRTSPAASQFPGSYDGIMTLTAVANP